MNSSKKPEPLNFVATQSPHVHPRILFICHSATLTGAPFVLYHLVSWLKQEKLCDFEVLLRDDGPMVPLFGALGPVRVLPPDTDVRLPRSLSWVRRTLIRLRILSQTEWERLLQQFGMEKFDLIYSNTITNGDLLNWLAPLHCPIVTHVHELEHWISACGPKNLQQVMRHTTRYIAASNAVKNHLVHKHAFNPKTIDVVHEFIATKVADVTARKPEELRKRLDLPIAAVIMVGSGHETWRKGKDLFVELCKTVAARKPDIPVFFLWVGGWDNERDKRRIEQQVRNSSLQDRIRFIGQVKNPLDYFAASDLFVLTSREDPYPLVCLEGALVNLPIVCFEGAGGMPEFVEHDAGFIVPYLDCDAMAEKMILLAENPELRAQLGRQAAEKVRRQHDIAVAGPLIFEIILRCVDPQRSNAPGTCLI
jgi:glycosyltransferase involved in cell wall biosynthesis